MSEFFDILIRFVPESARISSSGQGDGSVWLRLEQIEPETPNATGFEAWLDQNYGVGHTALPVTTIIALKDLYESRCDSSGNFEAEIHVHKSHPDLAYRLESTKGTWSDLKQVETDRKSSMFSVRNQNSYTISNEGVDHIICAQWLGSVFDQFGNSIVPPAISVSGAVMSFGQVVTGSIRVVYVTTYDIWYLTISPQDMSGDVVSTGSDTGNQTPTYGYGSTSCSDTYDENDGSVYETTIYGVYSGGIEELSLDVPEEMIGACGRGDGTDPALGNSLLDDLLNYGAGFHTGDDDDDDDDAGCYNRVVEVDPCTGEVLDEHLEQVQCPESS